MFIKCSLKCDAIAPDVVIMCDSWARNSWIVLNTDDVADTTSNQEQLHAVSTDVKNLFMSQLTSVLQPDQL